MTLRAHDIQTPRWVNELHFCAIVVALLLLATAVVYATGGTAYAFPYVQLIPVVLAAARYNLTGGIVVALVAALMLGPFMPMDVERGIDQSAANWITRAFFFLLIGAFTGWLFARVRAQMRERDRMAREDRTTGLANAAALEDTISEALASDGPHGVGPPVVFIVRIIDFFEALDAIGFDVGNELAGATARLIQSAVPELGPPYRFSAAEIAFVVQGLTPQRTRSLAADVKAAGEEPVDVRGISVRVELCVGAETARADELDRPYDPIRRAHLALAVAQERHQGYALYHGSFERSTREVFDLITRVRHGLGERQFELFYQPKIRLADGAVTGVEALIRWRDPESGIVQPGRFMPKVERTSLLEPLTRFAFEEACRFVDQHPDLGVSVNVSPQSLNDERLLDDLCETIEGLGAAASRVEIEITEGVVAEDPEQAAVRLKRLRAYGLPVSIDDFGTGYSSFSYIHRLPITGIKIDRSFLLELEGHGKVANVLRCITQVGRELGMEIVAEGVETEAQLAAVREIGCDMAQGFYFAQPQPRAELQKWLSAHRPERLHVCS